jgi:hypothetical protein
MTIKDKIIEAMYMIDYSHEADTQTHKGLLMEFAGNEGMPDIEVLIKEVENETSN